MTLSRCRSWSWPVLLVFALNTLGMASGLAPGTQSSALASEICTVGGTKTSGPATEPGSGRVPADPSMPHVHCILCSMGTDAAPALTAALAPVATADWRTRVAPPRIPPPPARREHRPFGHPRAPPSILLS